MHMNYCTLFDGNYLSRGIALVESIARTHETFHIHVLALDQKVADYFTQAGNESVTVVTVEQVRSMYPELGDIERERTRAEFCWTLTPFILEYCLRTTGVGECAYVDADLFFLASPSPVIESMGAKSVMITEHRYTPAYEQSLARGKYCVQYMLFRNDGDGREVLGWWRSQCALWCYNRVEGNKFGDQKYLDDWLSRFDCVFVPQAIGFALGPWNIQQYETEVADGVLYATDRITGQRDRVVFFHFHGLREFGGYKWYLCNYAITERQKEHLYAPYVRELYRIGATLGNELNGAGLPEAPSDKVGVRSVLRRARREFAQNAKRTLKDLWLPSIRARIAREKSIESESFLFVPPTANSGDSKRGIHQ